MTAGADPPEGAASGESAAPPDPPVRDPLSRLVHDLRSPLAVAEGFATLLARDDGKLTLEQRQDFARRVVESAAEMRRLIDEAADR